MRFRLLALTGPIITAIVFLLFVTHPGGLSINFVTIGMFTPAAVGAILALRYAARTASTSDKIIAWLYYAAWLIVILNELVIRTAGFEILPGFVIVAPWYIVNSFLLAVFLLILIWSGIRQIFLPESQSTQSQWPKVLLWLIIGLITILALLTAFSGLGAPVPSIIPKQWLIKSPSFQLTPAPPVVLEKVTPEGESEVIQELNLEEVK